MGVVVPDDVAADVGSARTVVDQLDEVTGRAAA
jgi:hypothetical protein